MKSDSLLIFDPSSSGHHGEYLENIIIESGENCRENITILSNPHLEVRLIHAKYLVDSKVKLIFLTANEVDYLDSSFCKINFGYRQVKLVNRYLSNLGIDKLILMDMNFSIFYLGLNHLEQKIKLRGILFNAYVPTKRVFGFWRKCENIIRNFRKLIQLRWLLRNKSIEYIFILNDRIVVEKLENHFSGISKFKQLPDPLPANSLKNKPHNVKFSNKNDFCFLLPGSMSTRKGCLETINALSMIPGNDTRKVKLKIIGKFSADSKYLEKTLIKRINMLHEKRKDIEVQLENRFYSSNQFFCEFALADCILIPYIKFFASSGIIGHACRYKKPIISCKEGLIGALVSQMGIGICVDPRNKEEFALAISNILKGKLNYSFREADRYLEKSKPDLFVQEILS